MTQKLDGGRIRIDKFAGFGGQEIGIWSKIKKCPQPSVRFLARGLVRI